LAQKPFKEPTKWGLKLVNDHYVPFSTTLKAAPQELMNSIHCTVTAKVDAKTTIVLAVKMGETVDQAAVLTIELYRQL